MQPATLSADRCPLRGWLAGASDVRLVVGQMSPSMATWDDSAYPMASPSDSGQHQLRAVDRTTASRAWVPFRSNWNLCVGSEPCA